VPLIAGGGHSPTPAVAEAGEIARERMGENVATGEAVDRSREVPETADSRRIVPEQGSKRATCRMDLPGPTTSVGTRTNYSVGPWDYPACATRHLKAWSTRTTQE
jgi:hypothetical protein